MINILTHTYNSSRLAKPRWRIVTPIIILNRLFWLFLFFLSLIHTNVKMLRIFGIFIFQTKISFYELGPSLNIKISNTKYYSTFERTQTKFILYKKMKIDTKKFLQIKTRKISKNIKGYNELS